MAVAGEDVVVADVGGALEVRREQRLLELALERRAAGLEREVQEPVRVDRVGVHGVEEPHRQALLGGDVDQLLLHLAHLGLGAPVLAGDHAGAQLVAVVRRGRVQLEGAVDDLDVVGVLERGQGRLQAPLADEAPRADDVTPDLDLHGGATSIGTRIVPTVESTVFRSSYIVYSLRTTASKEVHGWGSRTAARR